MFKVDENPVDGSYYIYIVIDGEEFVVGQCYQSRAAATDSIVMAVTSLLEDKGGE